MDSHREYIKIHYCIFAAIILIGAALRFNGLGSFSLRGDEEIMGLAARGFLETGSPSMPSGLFYPRAFGQVFLMALSSKIFGMSEWSLRFPSVVAGILGILGAFIMGRNYLPPLWNLAFAAVIAFNPWMIEMSQTARMYIFFSTALMLYGIMIFEWDQKDDWKRLGLVVLAYLISLHFYPTAIFFSFLVFLPVLTKPSINRFGKACVAFFLAIVSFRLYNGWLNSFYSGTYDEQLATADIGDKFWGLIDPEVLLHLTNIWWFDLILLGCLIALAAIFMTNKSTGFYFIASYILFFLTIGASFSMNYHLAGICFIIGAAIYLRCRGRIIPLVAFSTCFVLLFLAESYALYSLDLFPGIKKLLKAMIGKPSVFPYIVIFEEFPIGFLLLCLLMAHALKEFVLGKNAPPFVQLLMVAVWVPVLAMGFFKQYFPPRYVFPFVPFFAMSILSGIVYWHYDQNSPRDRRPEIVKVLLCIGLVTVLVFPLKLSISTNEKYQRFPDHRGAGEAMKKLSSGGHKNIIVAEDVLQQAYYLGKVDYWLRGFDVAKSYVKKIDGKLLNIYTNVPLIGTGDELENLINITDRGAIYIIGSGETVGVYHYFLCNNLWETLQKYNPEVVFTGKDNMTKIWYLPPVKG